MSKRLKNSIIGIIIVAVLGIIAWFSFVGNSAKTDNKVTIGIMSGTKNDDEFWNAVKKSAKDRYGLDIEYKKFTDYSAPNRALEQKQIDLDAFQHFAFLNNWNKSNKSNIVSIGETYLKPMKIYSNKYKSVKDIPENSKIIIPNDTTNESRALYLLKNAGLIKLSSGSNFKGINDITENKKNLKIKEVDASQTARSLNDVAASVVNTNFAISANLTKKQTIFTEPLNKDSKQWVNFVAANKDQKNNEKYKKVVKSIQNKDIEKVIKKIYGDKYIPAWNKTFK
ncbi:MetQ/NlpA family ABC transporter substrate-binding protein [Lactobacillus sp. S2-2]|uniref:MetQ/NlpA family ABC transporter substrate-binding protein n=1 Tax=Lactobacillus sp. S2-2 TaxID=2692917 RepID=UPI001F47A8D4|nr:MetQ/NlpA family ABC transporter substrate-binding protein [Lactobacillus sp. S2-2]MCF6514674.1 MetQ/NlpA family ABC transporter substrate-binding protein [Lactobacillus sp. S2-2]